MVQGTTVSLQYSLSLSLPPLGETGQSFPPTVKHMATALLESGKPLVAFSSDAPGLGPKITVEMVATIGGASAEGGGGAVTHRSAPGSSRWMRPCVSASLVVLLLSVTAGSRAVAQAPGAGWMLKPTPPREIAQTYWDLFKTTEAWTRLQLRRPNGAIAPMELIVQATWPGTRRVEPPRTITWLAQGAPTAMLARSTFVLTLTREHGTETVVDLTLPPFDSQELYACQECGFNAVESRGPASVLLDMAYAAGIRGDVLGIEVELQPGDIHALRALAKHVGLLVEEPKSERLAPPKMGPGLTPPGAAP